MLCQEGENYPDLVAILPADGFDDVGFIGMNNGAMLTNAFDLGYPITQERKFFQNLLLRLRNVPQCWFHGQARSG